MADAPGGREAEAASALEIQEVRLSRKSSKSGMAVASGDWGDAAEAPGSVSMTAKAASAPV